MTEEEIVELIKHQENAGMEALAEKYEKLLVYIIGGILGKRSSDIEECVNDTYVKLWKNIHRYDFERASLTAWLKVIARNTALNRLRDVKRHEELRHAEEISEMAEALPDEEYGVEQEIERREKVRHLNEVIRALPEKERELVLRKYFYLQSSKAIAQAMGMTVNAVDTKLSRLRVKVREAFMEGGIDIR